MNRHHQCGLFCWLCCRKNKMIFTKIVMRAESLKYILYTEGSQSVRDCCLFFVRLLKDLISKCTDDLFFCLSIVIQCLS